MNGRVRRIVVLCLLVISRASVADPSGQNTTSRPDEIAGSTPTTATTGTQPVVSEKARILLDKLDRAYTDHRPIRLQARIQGEFDVAGLSRTYVLDVTGYTDGLGLFRHEISSNRTLVQTVDRLILFDHTNHRFGTLIRKPVRGHLEQIPKFLRQVLLDENPALLAYISDKPSQVFVTKSDSVEAEENRLIISEKGGPVRRIEMNADGTIHSIVADYTRYLQEMGAQKIQTAYTVLMYHVTEPWEVEPQQFHFEIPSAATIFPLESELMRSRSDTSATQPVISPAFPPGVSPLRSNE